VALSLIHAALRLANHAFISNFEGHFEIVSMTGTVSIHGSHLHISISDEVGKRLMGIWVRLIIYTTRLSSLFLTMFL
jgi:predicted DNA-binding protein with PD1-like motif